LTPLERLKAHLALAQAAVVLYTLGRQLDAAKMDTHPVQKELVRHIIIVHGQHVGSSRGTAVVLYTLQRQLNTDPMQKELVSDESAAAVVQQCCL
jgi:hypothetical protein